MPVDESTLSRMAYGSKRQRSATAVVRLEGKQRPRSNSICLASAPGGGYISSKIEQSSFKCHSPAPSPATSSFGSPHSG